MSDTFAAFNAEQRAYADDQRRALDYSIDMACPDCGQPVPYSQMAVSGCPTCDEDELAVSA